MPRCARITPEGPCCGTLLPLSDFGGEQRGGQAASMPFKAWVCSNPDCGFCLAIDNGVPGYGDKVGMREPKPRRP